VTTETTTGVTTGVTTEATTGAIVTTGVTTETTTGATAMESAPNSAVTVVVMSTGIVIAAMADGLTIAVSSSEYQGCADQREHLPSVGVASRSGRLLTATDDPGDSGNLWIEPSSVTSTRPPAAPGPELAGASRAGDPETFTLPRSDGARGLDSAAWGSVRERLEQHLDSGPHSLVADP